MEPKKTNSANLQTKSFLFFNIGLVISLGLTIAAFNYKVYEKPEQGNLAQNSSIIEELIDPPITEQAPPPPPPLMQPQVVEVANDVDIEEEIMIDMDIETHVDQLITALPSVPQMNVDEDKEDPHEIFIIVEENAAPIGGMTAFYVYILDNLKYPASARRMGFQGKVFIQFIVEKDGSITDVQTVKGIGGGCDEEAERVIKLSPKWKAAKQRGKPVRQRMILPVTFQLAN